jgi:competence protein ComEC
VKHVSGLVEVEVVEDWHPGTVLAEASNRVRRALVRGARVLPDTERSLYLGFVLGDDRDEPPDVVDAFRASGLAHLTAVSGENVAFVLVCVAPLLRRLPLRARWLATLSVIAWFAVLTRFEPSVLRASLMAGLAVTATYLDRSASGVRVLALAVTAGTIADPFLVRSVGWWLSVGATAGLVTLAAPIARRLPGPRWLAEPLGLTIAAQIGVAPVAAGVFGSVPLVSLPANLLAAPAAGPLMVWGLPTGILAGLVPRLAPVVHLPSLVLVRWIVVVARLGARTPGALGPRPLLVGAAAGLAVAVGFALRHRATGRG